MIKIKLYIIALLFIVNNACAYNFSAPNLTNDVCIGNCTYCIENCTSVDVSNKVNKTGDSMSGELNMNSYISMNNNDIYNIGYANIQSLQTTALNINTVYANKLIGGYLISDMLTPNKFICSNNSDYLQSCDEDKDLYNYSNKSIFINQSQLNTKVNKTGDYYINLNDSSHNSFLMLGNPSFSSSLHLGAAGNLNFFTNWNPLISNQSDISKPSWGALYSATADKINFNRIAPGAGGIAANTWMTLETSGLTIQSMAGSGSAFACFDSNGKLYRSATNCI